MEQMSYILKQYDKRTNVKNYINPLWLISTRTKRMCFVFCMVTHSLFQPPLLRSVTFVFYLSPSLHISVHIPWKAFHAWAKCICLSSSTPHYPPYGLRSTSFGIFPGTHSLRLTSVREDAPGDPRVESYTLKPTTVQKYSQTEPWSPSIPTCYSY